MKNKDKNPENKKQSFIIRLIKSDFFIYIIFGVVATVVNMVAFRIFNSTLPFDAIVTQNVSYVLAWIISFFVAFFCNKFFVFKSKSMEPKIFWKEFAGFFTARIFSLFVHIGIANLCVFLGLTGDVVIGTMVFAKLLDDVSNLIGNIAEVILNYICSKLFIFKNKKPETDENK
ncbi:MAG: GtrA family protein [Clostridiales bacterium]|nr:GtrA family protein [Clostridiales bacterium]